MAKNTELFNEYQHLSTATLYRFLGQPHNVAKSKGMEFDDLLQYANEGLWKACQLFKEGQGKFQTFAINHIKWSVKNALNRESSIIKFNAEKVDEDEMFDLIGYDSPVVEGDDDDNLNFSDVIPSETDVEEEVTAASILKELSTFLTDREKKILYYMSLGWNIREISKEFGVSHQSIHASFKNIQKKSRENMEEIYDVYCG